MEYEKWYLKWDLENTFLEDNNKLKKKKFIYTPFPKTNQYGFQNGEIKGVIFSDILSRYNILNNKNVLYPIGFHSLCNTSFVENKKHSNTLNDDLSLILLDQIKKLGIGINSNKLIDMRHDEFLANLQMAFIELYEKNYIKYKETIVYYDKKNNKIYDYINKPKNFNPITHKCFILDINDIVDDIINNINNLKLSTDLKEKLINNLKPERYLKLSLQTSLGSTLDLKLQDPEYLGGLSFILLNPEYVDLTLYVASNEFNSVMQFLDSFDNEATVVFSGSYAMNPLTGADVPIFISTIYNEAIHLGIPGIDSDDKALAIKEGLDIIEIIDDDKLINSDFLDGYTIDKAREETFNAFIDALIAKEEIVYENREIVLSSLDSLGPLFPFLEEKDSGKINSLKDHLPYKFSEKLRPTLDSDVDIVGDTLSGTMNNLFIEGMCPIISMCYDSVGSLTSIFSSFAREKMNDYLTNATIILNENDIIQSIFMPLVFLTLINKENKFIDNICPNIILYKKAVDISYNDFKRSNNNLIDFNHLFDKYLVDSIRLFTALSSNDEEFVFDYYKLEDIDTVINKLYQVLNKKMEKNSKIEFEMYKFSKDVTNYLNNDDITSYAKRVYDFINDIVLEYGLDDESKFTFIKLVAPIFPYLAEEINLNCFDSKYSIMIEEWPL